ncbi:hypothetical protein [Halobellus ordinarius]|uniref:hypothetical protein n=1 Tax=Halobellus ordinarius TaxID=3075120 RepID=UPI0028806D61|nr:hypothetical protein [Halobellus sp. ZY16]
MAAEDIIEAVVALLIGGILFLTFTGSDPSLLLDIAPQIIILAVLLAIGVSVLRNIVDLV